MCSLVGLGARNLTPPRTTGIAPNAFAPYTFLMNRSNTPLSILLSILLLTGATGAASAQGGVWGNLDQGRWTVGFHVLDTVDNTRTFAPRFDADGNSRGSTPRPIRLCIWYPAAGARGGAMAARDYTRYIGMPGRTVSRVTVAEWERAERALITRMTKHEFTDAEWERVMSLPTAAHYDEPAAEGRFPVILTCAGPQRNPVFFEYLASHGYIVVSIPGVGRFTEQAIEFTPNPESIEMAVQDLQFVYAWLHERPRADLDRLGLWAFSSLSIYTTQFQLRNMAARAMLHVEGWEGFVRGREILEETPFYDPAAIRVPYMLLKKEKEEALAQYASDGTVFESFLYSPRYRVLVAGADHGDFNSMSVTRYATAEKQQLFENACRISRAFFDTYLKSDEEAGKHLDELLQSGRAASELRFEILPAAAPVPPTEAEVIAAFEGGRDAQRAAMDRISEVLESDGTLPYHEHVLSRFGRRLLREGRAPDAAVVFRVITRVFPTRSDPWDELADALEAAGDRDGAAAAAQKALELLPGDDSLSDEDRARMRLSLQQKIDRLSGGS